MLLEGGGFFVLSGSGKWKSAANDESGISGFVGGISVRY